MRNAKIIVGSLLGSALLAVPAGATTIALDYTHDNFFNSNAVARAALEQAALDVSNVLTSNLGATSDTISGTFGSTTATFDLDYVYTNPANGADVSLPGSALAADTVRIFVGARNLGAPTLGQGGPAGISLSLGGSGFPNEWPNAVSNASTNATANYGRGDGPTMYQVSGSSDFNGFIGNYSVGIGAGVSNLWFDNDANWHFDHTAPVAAGKSDLYSVALHEILHSVGFSSAESFEALRGSDINDWTGPAVLALLGSGDEVITADGHISEGRMSRRLFDLAAQEALMDPSITTGTRKFITELDLAFLQDMGWDVVAVPEPASLLLLAGAPLVLLARRRRA